jgi:hypothetical protein
MIRRVAEVIGSEKLAVSAKRQLRQDERVVGAIPASTLSALQRAMSRRILPLALYQQVKTPLRAIVATDQRVIVMRRGVAGFAPRRAGRIVSERAKSCPLDGELLSSGDLKVTTLGKALYLRGQNVADLNRLNLRLSNDREAPPGSG